MKLVRVRMLKVVQEPPTHYWYSRMVGQHVPLCGFDDGFWRSREPAGLLNFIAYGHAEPVWVLVTADKLHSYPYCHSEEAHQHQRDAAHLPKPQATGQSRRHSATEAAVNIGIGFVVSLVLTALVMPLFGHHVTASQNVAITSIFTVASLLRSYAVRRMFNRWAA